MPKVMRLEPGLLAIYVGLLAIITASSSLHDEGSNRAFAVFSVAGLIPTGAGCIIRRVCRATMVS